MYTKPILFILVCLLLLFALPAFAQEVTPTIEPPVVVEPPPPEEVVEVPLDYLWSVENRSNIALIVFGLIAAVAAGGSIYAVSVISKDAAEKLFLSAPPERQKIILSLVGFLDTASKEITRLAALLKEVTDGKPNEPPPAPPETPAG